MDPARLIQDLHTHGLANYYNFYYNFTRVIHIYPDVVLAEILYQVPCTCVLISNPRSVERGFIHGDLNSPSGTPENI